MSYKIVTDASADLTPQLVKEGGVCAIPMNYDLGDEQFVCDGATSQETLKNYYNAMREGKMTRTSQISPQQYVDFFRPFCERGENVLYLSLSSGLSSTYNSSLIAAGELAEEFPNVTIRCVDTLAATAGMTLLLEKAVENREAGMSIEENAVWLEENRLNVCHWFMVDDLMYLKRNGRISPAVAFVGAALGMKPLIRIEEDGSLTNFEKKRGRQAALDRLVEHYKESSEKPTGEHVFIPHTDAEDAANYCEKMVKKLNPSAVVAKVLMGPVIGCHVGPGFCAIAHFGKRI